MINSFGKLHLPQTQTSSRTSWRYDRISLTKNLPLLVFQIYLTFSLLIFAFGPLDFKIRNPIVLYSYVLIGQLCIYIGYKLGVSKVPANYNGRYSLNSLLRISILLVLLFVPPTLATRNYANISIYQAIFNSQVGFQATFDYVQSTPLLSIPRTLLSPILALMLPLGLIRWRNMTWILRALWLVGIGGDIAAALYVGRAFGIFEIALVVPWMLWLASNNVKSRYFHANRKRKPVSIGYRIRVVIVTIFVVLLAFLYFFSSRQARVSGVSGYPSDTINWSKEMYHVALPESVEFTLYYISRYLSLGYYGLSGSLELPFEWTYGIGHSEFLRRYARIFDSNLDTIEVHTYPARMQLKTGYSYGVYWHTIYPWLASDLTFPGALLFIGLMGYLLAQAWIDSLAGENPFALGFLGQMLLLFYYIPANALRFGRPESAFAFWGLLILWKLTRNPSSKKYISQ